MQSTGELKEMLVSLEGDDTYTAPKTTAWNGNIPKFSLQPSHCSAYLLNRQASEVDESSPLVD